MTLRVVFIGKNHDFSLLPFEAIRSTHQIVAIVESAPRRIGSTAAASVSFWRKWLNPVGSKSLEALAENLNVPYFRLSKHNEGDLPKLLASVSPDVLCIASLSQLLREDALLQAKHGAINLHPSLLPKYHGPFPWFWQYHDGVSEWGVTLHLVDAGQDTGPILNQDLIDVPLGTDITEAMSVAGRVGAKLFVRTLAEMEAGTSVPTPQPRHHFPKARIVRREERFIDWQSWPIERVWHFMRGTYPWHTPVAYPVQASGKRIARWSIGTYQRCTQGEDPGLVLQDQEGYFVSHKEGKIRITPELQIGFLHRRMNRLFNSHG